MSKAYFLRERENGIHPYSNEIQAILQINSLSTSSNKLYVLIFFVLYIYRTIKIEILYS